MKIFLPLFFLLSITTANAQNKDYLLTLEGMGPLKMGMTLPELEKLLQTKIILKVINVDSVVLTETISSKYKGIDVDIDLIKRYGVTDSEVVVNGLATQSPLCKTASGIGIGSTKLQVIAAFDGYHIDIQPSYSEEEVLVKSKTKSSIIIKKDREGDALTFQLLNNKVVSFSIYPIYDDEE